MRTRSDRSDAAVLAAVRADIKPSAAITLGSGVDFAEDGSICRRRLLHRPASLQRSRPL